jgi:hypothetical protein
MKQGLCICPLNWSEHCNFTGDGKYSERGWACTPHFHQPGIILPSWWNVRQKAAVATLTGVRSAQARTRDYYPIYKYVANWVDRFPSTISKINTEQVIN